MERRPRLVYDWRMHKPDWGLKAACGVLAMLTATCAARAPVPAPPAPSPPPVSAPAPPTAGSAVRPIAPPRDSLPSEAASSGVTRFSFIAYGDTRGLFDGKIVHPEHARLVDIMLARVKALASTPFPVRFVVQSGDAVSRGQNAAMWNVSFTPIIEKLTGANLPYFFAVGNHDVTGMPPGDPNRELGLRNALAAMAKLIPPEGSPRRLNGYATYAFGYGNTFFIALDSNIASDATQLAWVTAQLEQLDRRRYPHIVVFLHHPPISSGPHGAKVIEPATAALRRLYVPLFRRHHVQLDITGHDHLYDHWVEHYVDGGVEYRMDHLVSGGGGAPTYKYEGEPDLSAYVAAGAAEHVRVDHLMRPALTPAGNPHHFVIVRVDGDRLSLDVVGIGPGEYKPYGGRSSHADLN